MKKTFIFLIALLIISGCTINTHNHVELEGKKIFIEIARTQAERTTGLMHRQELCEECGMLFIFSKEETLSFWMKNTLIPLDMVFINADLEVVDVLHAEPCTQDPCKSYTPKEKAMYVLETNKGMFNKQTIGKKIKITHAQDT